MEFPPLDLTSQPHVVIKLMLELAINGHAFAMAIAATDVLPDPGQIVPLTALRAQFTRLSITEVTPMATQLSLLTHLFGHFADCRFEYLIKFN